MRQALTKKQQQIAVQYLPLIERVAKRMVRRLPSHIELGDLISAGMLGLADAIFKFDPARETRFEEYAEWRIKGAILDQLRESDPLTRDQRREVNEVKKATRELEQQLGRAPEEEEVANALHIDIVDLRSRRERQEAATTAPVVDNFEHHAANLDDTNPESAFLVRERHHRTSQAIRSLQPRLRVVVDMACGEELSLKEIGNRLGVTESRACQLRGEAIKELRTRMAA